MKTIQYTIRNIPQAVDRIIRKRAKQEGISFNQAVVDLLTLQVFGSTTPSEDNDFDWIFNKSTLDNDFDTTIKEFSQVDKALWQ